MPYPAQPKPKAIGIDIGGTNTVFGLVDHEGHIYTRGSMPTSQYDNVTDYIDALHKTITTHLEAAGDIISIQGIGIGAPNSNYYAGTIEYPPNLKWPGITPFTNLIKQKFGLPAIITNDANAAAIGELMYGTAKGLQHFIAITLGTGVGGGIVINGKVVYGHDGFAGELGHTIVKPNGRVHWSTGSKGSLEAYCSATGVRNTVLELLSEDRFKESPLHYFKTEDITLRKVDEFAWQGDALCLEVYRLTGEILGIALANFIMFSSPEAIILMGGLCKAGKLLMDPTRHYMEESLLPIFRNKVNLSFSELRESDAPILGASALVWQANGY